MTDKQIIIDGVDVSECERLGGKRVVRFFKEEKLPENSYWCNTDSCEVCNNNPNCYYKQLKRKEQECERLKICGTPSLIGLLSIENKKLKQTLTEIKEIAQYDVYTSRTDLCLKLNWIKKKISECEVEE